VGWGTWKGRWGVTEAEWDGCTEPRKLVEYLRGLASERRFRLFACACCRQVWGLLDDARSRKAVEVAERFADGLTSRGQLRAATVEAHHAKPTPVRAHPASMAAYAANGVAWLAAWSVALHRPPAPIPQPPVDAVLRVTQANLLRDIFPRFRRVAVDPAWLAWRGGTIARLAQAAYTERELPSGYLDAARLAVLADALEESGCADAHLLAHLRGPGPHVRGCAVLDALLGRE
jgi:hypothetical protein